MPSIDRLSLRDGPHGAEEDPFSRQCVKAVGDSLAHASLCNSSGLRWSDANGTLESACSCKLYGGKETRKCRRVLAVVVMMICSLVVV